MTGVYVHIPFCRQSCIYCNFYFLNGNRQSSELVESLLKEIDIRVNKTGASISTIYFGGGTPSFIEPELIHAVMAKLLSKSSIAPEEITLEANPDDVTEERLLAWKNAGINRLSLGVQSFHAHHLKWMNRAHDVAQAEYAIESALAHGFELSIDLIFGIPGSSNEEWRYNLEKANSYGIHHLSCYGLTLEENTPWKKLIASKKYSKPDDNLTAIQFTMAMEYLQSQGWEHYEISNYCRPGYRARHNTSYWQDKPYIGIGPSAHSFDGNTRSWNVADINAYVQAIGKGELPLESEQLGNREKYNEYVMTKLRTAWGLDPQQMSAFGFEMDKILLKLEHYIAEGMMEKRDGYYVLTNEGKLYADAIASSLFAGD